MTTSKENTGLKIWLVGSITPVNDVAGPLIVYRHFKYFEKNGHDLKVITHQFAGFQAGEKWETVKLKHTFLIKLIRRIFFRKYLRWLGEELISALFYIKATKEFNSGRPDILLTTWSDYLLPCAYNLAKKYNLPLIIFCHDDLENQIVSDPINNFYKRKRLKKFYQFAVSRLCVAEGMNEEFYKRYEVWGDVLYPIGGEIATTLTAKAERSINNNLVFGYFGSISNGYEPLLFFANCLKKLDGELHISSTGFPQHGPYAIHTKIKDLGFFKERTDLLKYIHEHVDVCIVAQSFKPEDEIFLKTNFPSKLIDMMGFNLPIVIISPPYSSSARIAIENPDTFIYIDTLDENVIRANFLMLQDPEKRSAMALKISQLYQKKYAPAIIHDQLENIIKKHAKV